ncbi:MAG TPA: YggT family protein [Thermoanaerobaculia bacterium]|nr:YggT family protein [Thermoanaerobaculia bacterium]
MPVLKPFLDALLIILDVLQWIIFVWVILSWILFFARQSQWRWRHRKAYHVLEQLDDIFSRMTFPFLRPFRRMLRRFDTRGIDWSPLLLLLAIFILRGLIASLYGLIL